MCSTHQAGSYAGKAPASDFLVSNYQLNPASGNLRPRAHSLPRPLTFVTTGSEDAICTQMAPLSPRQTHSLTPSTPRIPKGPSSRPVPVTTSIDPKVFGELLAGTVTIFIIAVLIWKTGKFIRSFNRHRVLREGKSPKARYARTWYGWVCLETHERNKRIFRDMFAKIREWTAWKSTRTDFRWVWWDPGRKALEERQQNRRFLRWLPECFKSYDFMTADEIWSPGPPVQCHGALTNPAGFETAQSTKTLRRRRRLKQTRPRLANLGAQEEHLEGTSMSIKSEGLDPWPGGPHSVGRCEGRLWSKSKLLKELSKAPSQVHSLPILRGSSALMAFSSNTTHERVQQHGQSATKPDSLRMAHDGRRRGVYGLPGLSREQPGPIAPRGDRSQRYRKWSAQMQVKTKRPALLDLRDSSGPPGTPMTNILASHLSEQSFLDSKPGRQYNGGSRPLEGPIDGLFAGFCQTQASAAKQIESSKPTLPNRRDVKYNTVPPSSRLWTSISPEDSRQQNRSTLSTRVLKKTNCSRRAVNDLWPSSQIVKPASCVSRNLNDRRPENSKTLLDGLTDWEVKLMDGLDRKLVWMVNELTPGQKPYHFALLANHWLNRETWLVIDPVSRVSTDNRRLWGDPRFNVPYPEPTPNARPKYPVSMPKRVQNPRLDSWRAAINSQRKVSGDREVVRAVELCAGSVEEPPDGKIDPAAWLLPKPPQGYEMSSNQKNAWYEGGAGWQEKLEDWQQVRRGYRLRKALYEGRVNRNHAKEVATQVGKCCRSASVTVVPKIKQTQYPTPPVP